LSEAKKPEYPVSEQYKVLEGYDIYRSNKLIVALVVVESKFGRDMRLYRWQLRGENWKVDLCRMSVSDWNFSEISSKANELVEKYEIKRRRTTQEASQADQ
jgi:hypothetical protein